MGRYLMLLALAGCWRGAPPPASPIAAVAAVHRAARPVTCEHAFADLMDAMAEATAYPPVVTLDECDDTEDPEAYWQCRFGQSWRALYTLRGAVDRVTIQCGVLQ